MDQNKTIDEAARYSAEMEAVDPEDQETVLFGQRQLFQDVDLAAAKRQAEAQKTRQRARQRRTRRAVDDAPDTVVTAPPVAVAGDLERVGNGSAQRVMRRSAAAESWLEGTPDEVGPTIEVSAKEASARGAPDSLEQTGQTGRPARPVEPEQRAKEQPESAGRRVAERRPVSAPGGHRHRRTSEANSSCRMCGRSVGWPKARRFRGRKSGSHGFRCDTCGNVFCAEHVLRNSSFWESLLHHGRFRCLLCALGQMAKQAERVRARAAGASGKYYSSTT